MVPVHPSQDWIDELHEDLGTAFPELLADEEDVYVCTSWGNRDGKTIETMAGPEAAADFQRFYGESRLQELHVRQDQDGQQYDVVLETDSHDVATSYIEARDQPVPDTDDSGGLRVRYTNDIHEE